MTEGGRTGAEVARELGVNANMLYSWKAQYHEDTGEALPRKGHLSAEQQALVRLRRENARFKEERDISKKWPHGTLRRTQWEIPLHRSGTDQSCGMAFVPGVRRVTQWLLLTFHTVALTLM
jgi:transposase